MPLYFSLSLHIPFSLSLNTFVFTCLVKIVILQISAQMSPICETFPALQKHTESTSPLFSKCHSPALCHIALLGKYLFSCLFFSLNESHLKEKGLMLLLTHQAMAILSHHGPSGEGTKLICFKTRQER